MIGYTEIKYGDPGNEITLVNCQTLKFDQQRIRDQSGQSDHYDKFTVRVVGFFLAQDQAATGIEPKKRTQAAGHSAGEHYIDTRQALLVRRKPFKMTLGVGGPNPQVILEAVPLGIDPAAGGYPDEITTKSDLNNGPIPEVISFQRISGNAAIRIEWEVTVCLIPCLNTYSQGSFTAVDSPSAKLGILSNRWSCADEINENWWTVRTWTGRLKLAHPLRNPHEFRELCVPAIQPGMRRTKLHFVASEDGLELQYTVTDEEVYLTAPYPAHSMTISHKERASELNLNVATAFAVTVKGDRQARKIDLLLLCMAVAEGKLQLGSLVPALGAIGDRNARILSYEVADFSGTMADNSVSLTITLMRYPFKKPPAPGLPENGLFSHVMANFGRKLDGTMIEDYINTLSYGNREGELPAAVGPIPIVGAFSVFLQTACSDDKSMNRGMQYQNRQAGIVGATIQPVEPPLPQIDTFVVPNLPEETEDPGFSNSHKEAIYQTYHLDTEYRETTMVCQMPIARPGVTIRTTPDTTGGGSGSGSSGGSGGGNTTIGGGSSANAPDLSAFVRIGPSQHQRVIRLEAERYGQPPRLPFPTPAFIDEDGLKNVLLSQVMLSCEPTRSPDGEAKNYVMRAEFIYGLSGVPKKIRLAMPDYESEYGYSPNSPETPYKFNLTSIFSSNHPIG
jgi:hypothetical protein